MVTGLYSIESSVILVNMHFAEDSGDFRCLRLQENNYWLIMAIKCEYHMHMYMCV